MDDYKFMYSSVGIDFRHQNLTSTDLPDQTQLIPCAAEFFVSIFSSFEAGIANAISSFK